MKPTHPPSVCQVHHSFIRIFWCALVLMLLLPACLLQNASRSEKLHDTVTELNDHARWGRVHVATQQVDPKYRQRFVSQRQDWGQDLRIADSELQQVQIDEKDNHATSIMTISWYAMSDMQLQQSVLQQRWEESGSGYVLVEEKVVDGNAHLFGTKAPNK